MYIVVHIIRSSSECYDTGEKRRATTAAAARYDTAVLLHIIFYLYDSIDYVRTRTCCCPYHIIVCSGVVYVIISTAVKYKYSGM